MASAFPAETTFLVSAKRRAGVEFVEGVGPYDACLDAFTYMESLGSFVRPDAAR